MQTLEIIKKYLGEDATALDVELFAGVKERTLFNWYNDKPQTFRAVILGAAIIKKKLALSANELESKRIELLTQKFIEQGGNVELVVGTVMEPEDVPPVARKWGNENFD